MMNTANKRASAIGIALAVRLVLPVPDGTIDQADRQQVAYSYAGILANPAIVGPAEIVSLRFDFMRVVDADLAFTSMMTVDATIRTATDVNLHLKTGVDFTATTRTRVDFNVER